MQIGEHMMQYGLIGEKLSHSFSKEIHESLADYTYELCEIPKHELSEFLAKRDFRAVNVTIPYKQEAIPHLDEISDAAEELQAVNVIVNRGGKLCGYNTDYFGMRDMILRSGIELRGKKVLILGTGGTSRTSRLVCKNLGASEIYQVSRSQKDGAITYADAYALHGDADIIINTTPVGMFPDSYSSPLELDKLNNLCAVFDAVYNPIRTSLVSDAKERGIYAEAGLYMLVSQAYHAAELFLDTELPDGKIDEIYKNILKSKENIVLIGMPSSGKSTVGKLLTDGLKRDFLDLDTEIEKHIGCSIADFFKTHTEKEFRDIETEITEKISKRNGIVIATGGGCVLREGNVRALRSNGRLYFIDRSPKALTPTESRPLATRASDIARLYSERYDIYCSACDSRIDGNLSPWEEADLIRKDFMR